MGPYKHLPYEDNDKKKKKAKISVATSKKPAVLALAAAAVCLVSLSARAVPGTAPAADAAGILHSADSGGSRSRYDAALYLQYAVGLIGFAPGEEPDGTPVQHVHEWTLHPGTGHYEQRKTGKETVAAGTYWEETGGWDEEREPYFRCNTCGECFPTASAINEHLLLENHAGYSYRPSETVHHDGEWILKTRYETRDVYEDVFIVDSEAYWSCPCGESAYSLP